MSWFFLADIGLVTFAVCLGLASQASRLKLLALPGEHRQHQVATPMVGGIAIFIGLFIGCIVIDSSYKNLLPSLFFLCVVGVIDDRFGLPSWTRFLAQGIAAYLMILLTGVELTSLGNLVSDKELLLGGWSLSLTIFAVIGVINAVNMSDGMDGLVGSLVLLVILSLFIVGAPNQSLILVSALSITGFLVLNLRIGRAHAKVFLGDAGSTMLGLLLAYLLINASQNSDSISPVTALWLLAVPLIDAVSVLLARPIKGRSPFSADRVHYHHQLLDRGFSVNSALVTILSLQLILILVGIVFSIMNITQATQFYLFLGLFSLYFFLILKNS